MASVYLLLGSSLGDRIAYLEQAAVGIEKHIGKIEKHSSLYETPPWGFNDSHLFLNQALLVNSQLEPLAILNQIQAIEESLGRIRNKEAYEARTLDIDILFYDDLLLNSPSLVIPHSLIQERRFALAPICEIAPQLIHPLLNKTSTELLDDCSDKSNLKILSRLKI